VSVASRWSNDQLDRRRTTMSTRNMPQLAERGMSYFIKKKDQRRSSSLGNMNGVSPRVLGVAGGGPRNPKTFYSRISLINLQHAHRNLQTSSATEARFVLLIGLLLSLNAGYINGLCLGGLLDENGSRRQGVSAFTGERGRSEAILPQLPHRN